MRPEEYIETSIGEKYKFESWNTLEPDLEGTG